MGVDGVGCAAVCGGGALDSGGGSVGSTGGAGCTSGILVLVGVTGVGCDELSAGGGITGWVFDAAGFLVPALAFAVSVVAMRFFSVPVARTSSMILLVTGAAALTACAITAGAGAGVGTGAGRGASFFAAAFVVRAGAFFSLSTLTAISFFTSATLALALVVAPFFASTAGVPTSSAATFFGRPRFLAGASTGVVTDMLRAQLMRFV
jgi:hypothetical protein